MEQFDLYQDISQRTDGDIYIGVVGPVRTGKSTFIKRVMDTLVLPNIENPFQRERAQDELPQSGAGKTIMTTQPHFVPNEAVEIQLKDSATLSIRLIDCVGYLVKGALGHLEDGEPRMVRTPWYDHDIPFEDAAEMGTRKVISEHSTIGMLVTTDGSITEIPRTSYIEAEERVVSELKAQKKPFIIVLNSATPQNPDTIKLRDALNKKYDVPVKIINAMQMDMNDISELLELLLFEFPLVQMEIDLPGWMQALPAGHWLISHFIDMVRACALIMERVRDYKMLPEAFEASEYLDSIDLFDIALGRGVVKFHTTVKPGLYYRIISEECGFLIKGEDHLLELLKELAVIKREYERVSDALSSARDTGYGLVSPTLDEMTLEEPEIVRQGSRFGVRLKASAPSLHMMRVDIQTEVSPVVGTEKQSEELVRYLLSEFEGDPAKIWQTNIFGKSLHELVKEGLSNKLSRMPEDAQMKIAETLQRIINEGSGGLICILL